MTLYARLLVFGFSLAISACHSGTGTHSASEDMPKNHPGIGLLSQAFFERDLGYDFTCSDGITEKCEPVGVSLSDASCVFVEGGNTYFPIIRCALSGTYEGEAFSENRQYRWAILPDDIMHAYYWAGQRVDTAKAISAPFDPRVPYPSPLEVIE